MQPACKTHNAVSRQNLSPASALDDCFACGVLVANNRQRIITCNPEAERLLGLKLHAARSGPASLLPRPLQAIARKAASTGMAVTNRVISFSPRSREPVRLYASAIPIQWPSTPGALVIILLDRTSGKGLDLNLCRLDRLASLGTLSASMAHEIKNALVSVKTFVDLLLEKNRDAELADVVRREMLRIDGIVGQMLKYAGPSRAAFSNVRVHDVLDHALRMVQPRLDSGLISLHRAFQAAPDAIEGDDYQLEQAFLNLFLNAIEAMGANGSLTVKTDLISAAPARSKAARASGSHLCIAISDTGVGISPENMHRLFEPFFTTKQQGTGLGLTITRRIVNEHNGDISVQSAVNQGTTFSIKLPLHAPAR